MPEDFHERAVARGARSVTTTRKNGRFFEPDPPHTNCQHSVSPDRLDELGLRASDYGYDHDVSDSQSLRTQHP